MNIYAVIMAGGIGSRFWPRSKEKTPKQLLRILDSHTMLQSTVKRLKGIIGEDKIYIVTNKHQSEEVRNQLLDYPSINIIEEPFGRNTASCIGLASIIIKQRDNDAVTVVLPSDHNIDNEKAFGQIIKKAAVFADQSNGLVTIGIMPTRPETGYGYIQIDEREVEQGIFKVYTFAEKPNFSTAVRFVDSGDFLWNSGIFIWRVDAILEEIRNYMPDLYEGLNEISGTLKTENQDKTISNIYGRLRSISIDYGVMEKSQRVYLVKGNFVWSDIGSWEEVYHFSSKNQDGNVEIGNVYTEMTIDSYIFSPDKFTAVIGAENLIIINTEKSLLVCRRDKAQEVKKIIDHLKIKGLKDYL